MKVPSSTVPPAQVKKQTIAGWIFLGLAAGAVSYGLIASVRLRWGFGGLFVLVTIFTVFDRRRLARLREKRKEESIRAFYAQALPTQAHDPRLVRAVFEEMSRLVDTPLQASDDIKKFWRPERDGLGDLAFRIARRAGRSMDDPKQNPMYDGVATIEDMIAFFEHQPKLPDPPSQPAPAEGPRR